MGYERGAPMFRSSRAGHSSGRKKLLVATLAASGSGGFRLRTRSR